MLTVNVEFRWVISVYKATILMYSGGMELLFDKKTTIRVEIKDGSTIRDLLHTLVKEHLKERPELFVQGDTV